MKKLFLIGCLLMLFFEGCYFAKKGIYVNSISRKNNVVFRKSVDSVLYKLICYADTLNDTTCHIRDMNNLKSYVIFVWETEGPLGYKSGNEPIMLYTLHAVPYVKDSNYIINESNYMEYRKAIKKTGRYAIINKRYKIPLVYGYDKIVTGSIGISNYLDYELFRIAQSISKPDYVVEYGGGYKSPDGRMIKVGLYPPK